MQSKRSKVYAGVAYDCRHNSDIVQKYYTNKLNEHSDDDAAKNKTKALVRLENPSTSGARNATSCETATTTAQSSMSVRFLCYSKRLLVGHSTHATGRQTQ